MASKEHNSEKCASVSSGFAELFLRKLQENLDRKNQSPGCRIYIKEIVSVFAYEISCMMHTLGDIAHPLKNSVLYLETILRDQMNLLLIEASEVSCSKTLTHEHLLTLLVKNREKMTRLLHYLFLKDSSELLGKRKYDQFFDVMSSAHFGVRVRTCLEFLTSINAGDYDPETITTGSDDVALERMARKFQMSSKMTNEQYLEFSRKQCICFYPKGDGGKFKDWLLADKVTTLQPTALALDILSFFARETVAEVVEASLPSNRPKPKISLKLDSDVPSNLLKINSQSTNQPQPLTDFDLDVSSSLSGMLGLKNILADRSGSFSNIDSLAKSGSLGVADIFALSTTSLDEEDLAFSTEESPPLKKRRNGVMDSDGESYYGTSVIGEKESYQESTSRCNVHEPKILARDPDDPITVEDLKAAVINLILSIPGKFHMRKKKRILCL
ncbi:unnamed protein product [Larinioides sclopetarius]|uniref:Uncharacterized protein n=1 Tax=Larinioides sclopetarius TaxID=280406 RepID=A0AAV1ZK29_9ARAC